MIGRSQEKLRLTLLAGQAQIDHPYRVGGASLVTGAGQGIGRGIAIGLAINDRA